MKLDFRQRLLTTTLLVGAGMLASPAFAQDAQPAPVAPDSSAVPAAAAPPSGPVEAQPTPTINAQGAPVAAPQEIIVTGSRIPQPNLQSAAPVAVVSNQDIKLSGTSRVEDILGQLPSAEASQSSGMSNAASGTAEIDLRYLGAKRTLTLVNGRRLTPGDPASTSQAADINMIPAALIKRVDVLTGGASSVYGADAVAGVVNFIMDTDFSGVRFDGNWSTYQHNNRDIGLGVNCFGPQGSAGCTAAGERQTMSSILAGRHFADPQGSTTDGRAIDGTVALGAGFDDGRGHVTAYFGYRKVNPVLQANRNYSACTIQESVRGPKTAYLPNNARCGGSATAAPGNALIFTALNATTSTTGALGPGTITTGSANLYNFAPLNYFQRPDERYTAGAFANYEINSAMKPYLEFMFMDDHTLAQIAPSGDFFNTNQINCNNPLISDVAGSGGGGFADGDPRQNNSVRQTICNPANQIVGFIGDFPVAAGAPYNVPSNGAGLGGTDAVQFIDPVTGLPYTRALFQLGRRNVEGGPRAADFTHTAFRGVVGMRGDLSPAFSYDAYYQYGRTNYSLVYHNEFSTARLNRALDVVSVDPTTGQEVPLGTAGAVAKCRSVLTGQDPNCVPYDVFGTPSAASINYLNVFGVITGRTSEQIADVNVTGDLGQMGMQSPWASDGIGVNVGYEYRKESLTLNPDQEFQTGDLTGQGAPTLPVSGSFHVNEVFGEVRVPIVQHNFFDDLSLEAGYRKSWYTTVPGEFNVDASGNQLEGRKYSTNTYKLSAEFAPIRDIRFRGSYNRAVRAPNIQELFRNQFTALDGSVDPCAGHKILPTEYGCIASGLAAGVGTPSNPAGQYNGMIGGNPNLTPEKATTKTVGVVLQPRFVPRFALSVDYWNIDLKNAIQGFGADAIIKACVNDTTASSVSPACALVHRSASGSLWLQSTGYIIDLPSNAGEIKTDGIDFNASYSHRMGGWGNLSASFLGTKLLHYKVNNGLSPEYDCAGLYGSICSGAGVASSAPMPKWRHKARVTWDTPIGLGLSLQWRRVGKVMAETLSDVSTLHGDFPVDPGLHIKAQNYFDLAATYSLFDKALNLRAGVNNLFDRNPPLVQTGSGSLNGSNLCPTGPCNGNTYPGTWDSLGRYIYAGATLTFGHHVAPPPPPMEAPPPPPPPPPPPATQTCPDGSVILATAACPAPPPPPPPPAPAPERGH